MSLLDLSGDRIPIRMDAGDTLNTVWTFTDNLPLAGQTFTFVADDANGVNVLTGTCTIIDSPGGVVTVTIPAAATVSLEGQVLFYTFRRVIGTTIRTIAKGPLEIQRVAQ